MHPILRVLAALSDAGYVVVGGVAVTLQGHIRATVDLDLVVDLVPDNLTAALGGLSVPVASRGWISTACPPSPQPLELERLR